MQSPNSTAKAGPNPNTSWLNMRGTWLTNLLLVLAFRFVFSLIPGVTTELCWTLTNVTYNIVHRHINYNKLFKLLHLIVLFFGLV